MILRDAVLVVRVGLCVSEVWAVAWSSSNRFCSSLLLLATYCLNPHTWLAYGDVRVMPCVSEVFTQMRLNVMNA